MKQCHSWPPPNWTEVIVAWDDILAGRAFNPKVYYSWCAQHRGCGRWHVHGWQATKGFAFRFEDPKDAVLFKLRWS